jgi:tripartite-type tricarboxylate transporter receptor subunit TctC
LTYSQPIAIVAASHLHPQKIVTHDLEATMQSLYRRKLVLCSALVLAATTLPVATSFANSTTTAAPVRIVVPFSAAGPTDFIARLFAQALSDEMKTTVIVENKPGASGNIGTQFVVDGPNDGTVLVHTTAAMQAVNPIL